MIKVQHLSRSFGDIKAVDDISFSVNEGEVLGFLGPNGAGKSTTMKMLTGFLSPSAGDCQIYGHSILHHALEAKRRIGYLPEGAPAYADMSVIDFLQFIADVRCIPKEQKNERIEKIFDQLQLERVRYQSIETLSKGFKRRVGLAQAVLHDPKVLILDEPTDGLDPNQKHEVRALIRDMAKDKIIIISTHILEEVNALCSRTIIIHQGKLLIDCSPDELAKQSRYYQAVRLSCRAPEAMKDDILALDKVDSVQLNSEQSNLTAFPKKGESIFSDIHQLIQKRGWPIDEIQVEHGRLDEVFRSMTQGDAA